MLGCVCQYQQRKPQHDPKHPNFQHDDDRFSVRLPLVGWLLRLQESCQADVSVYQSNGYVLSRLYINYYMLADYFSICVSTLHSYI